MNIHGVVAHDLHVGAKLAKIMDEVVGKAVVIVDEQQHRITSYNVCYTKLLRFAALRYGLAAVGNLALVWPVKKIAAVVALVAAALYLWIAGPQVATQRAFLMIV